MSLTLLDQKKLDETAELAGKAANRWDQLIKIKIDDAVQRADVDLLTGEINFAKTRASSTKNKYSYVICHGAPVVWDPKDAECMF